MEASSANCVSLLCSKMAAAGMAIDVKKELENIGFDISSSSSKIKMKYQCLQLDPSKDEKEKERKKQEKKKKVEISDTETKKKPNKIGRNFISDNGRFRNRTETNNADFFSHSWCVGFSRKRGSTHSSSATTMDKILNFGAIFRVEQIIY